MRMIGHQILQHSGDSLSRILPIESEKNSYLIKFENKFSFDPDDLEKIIDEIVKESTIPKHYVVEVLGCEGEDVVYSYEKGGLNGPDIIACRGRFNPSDCYQILFTILPGPWPAEVSYNVALKPTAETSENTQFGDNSSVALVVLALFGLLLFFRSFRRKKRTSNPNMIQIGNFQFDKKNMELLHGKDKSELTSKESDLLYLLYSSANNTINRETILKDVWENESEYVGRTLDVFISKLRKKLESDTSVKIVNVRGVGYKMVLNG